MAKPSSLPRWATDGAAAITEPSSGKKDIGWEVSEKPPAAFFNWLLNLIYLWLAYLDTFLSDAHTWTGKQTFDDVTVGGDFVAPALGTVDFQGSTAFTGVGSTHAIAGNVTIGGTLAVTGAAALGPTSHADATASATAFTATSVDGTGLQATASGNGQALRANSNGARAPMGMTVRTSDPVTLVDGDFWIDSSHRLNIVVLGSIYRVTLT